jgi:hypothetical protein
VTDELRRVFEAREGCPSIEELAADQNRFRQHVSECAHCSAELALLRSFESGQASAAERPAIAQIVAELKKNSPAKQESWWQKMWRPRVLVPLAVGLAAAALVIVMNVPRPGNSLDAPFDNVVRSTQLAVISPVGLLAQTPSQLKWSPVNGAASYKVQVLEVDRTTLWSASSYDAYADLPGEVRAKIVPLKTILWEVSALDASGHPIASSGMQSFTVR